MASIYEKKGNIIKALEYFSLALKISEDINNLISQAILLNNLASIYRNQGEFDKAFEMYFSSLKIRDKLKDESGKAAIYNNLAFTYNKQGKSDLALKYYAESLKIRKKLENKGFLSESYGNIGMVYYFNKDFSLAKMYFDSSYAISTKASSKRALLYSLLHYAQYNYSIDNTEEALKNAKQAYDLAQELGFTDEIKSCSEILYKIYKRNGNAGEALKMYEVFVLMKDSLSNLENSKAANKQQFKYEYQKKKEQDSLVYVKERDLAATKLKQERTTKIALYSIIGVILVFSFFLYNRFRLIKKQKHIIELKEKETTHQNEIIIEQKIAVEEKQKEILDSIHYARRIQKALLAHQEYIDKFLPNNFILFQPKDIVSGDFYWAAEHNDKFYLAICDSTGHGVPGAFMSILSIGFLSEAIKEKNIAEPNNILNYVRKRLIESISSDGQKDGFDGVLICFDKGEISYSAANNAPVMVLDGNYRVLPKDKMPVGTGERNSDFELFKIEASVGSMLYVYTDGYADQFGGVGGKKFMYKRLNDLLAKCSNQDLLSQKQIMEDTINKWRGSLEQVDDICLVGIRL